MPRTRKPDPRFHPPKPKPPIPLPAVPTARMVDAAMIAAAQATGERLGDVHLDPRKGAAGLYAFGALYDLFTAAPDGVAKRMGVGTSNGWMAMSNRSRALRASSDWRPDFAGFVARQLGIAVDRWRTEQDAVAQKRAEAERERSRRRQEEARVRRDAEIARQAEDARADHERRVAAEASAREIERASEAAAEARKSRLTPRVYVKMRTEDRRVAPGLRTARARDDWWNGTEARSAASGARAVFEVPGAPPKGRSALEMRERDQT